MSHTPGPWKAARTFVNNEPDRWTIHNGPSAFGSIAIATVYAEEDAQFIAAGPAMFEALDRICAEAWFSENDTPSPARMEERLRSILQCAREARHQGKGQ